MKKIILLIALALIGIQAQAQLNVTSTVEKGEITEVCTIRSMYSRLMVHNKSYYIAGRTDNRFDDPFIFTLGQDAESSIQTLKDMLSIIENKTELVNVQQGNKKYTISLLKMVGRYYLGIKEEGLAGDFNITIKELEKCIKKIKERENLE